MKAASYPFDSVQRPPTVFGLPVGLLMLSAAVSMLLAAVTMAAGPPPIVPIGVLLIALPATLALSWRARVRDPHVERPWC